MERRLVDSGASQDRAGLRPQRRTRLRRPRVSAPVGERFRPTDGGGERGFSAARGFRELSPECGGLTARAGRLVRGPLREARGRRSAPWRWCAVTPRAGRAVEGGRLQQDGGLLCRRPNLGARWLSRKQSPAHPSQPVFALPSRCCVGDALIHSFIRSFLLSFLRALTFRGRILTFLLSWSPPTPTAEFLFPWVAPGCDLHCCSSFPSTPHLGVPVFPSHHLSC